MSPIICTASIMYELPAGKGKRYLNHGAGAAILGGWQVNTITSLRSGQPYNLDVLGDVGNIGNGVSYFNYARPNVNPAGGNAKSQIPPPRSISIRRPSPFPLTLLETSGKTCCGPRLSTT